MSNLQRYSSICEECAKKEGGQCHKEIVCGRIDKCVVCGVESFCLSCRDYNLPLVYRVERVEEVKDE